MASTWPGLGSILNTAESIPPFYSIQPLSLPPTDAQQAERTALLYLKREITHKLEKQWHAEGANTLARESWPLCTDGNRVCNVKQGCRSISN